MQLKNLEKKMNQREVRELIKISTEITNKMNKTKKYQQCLGKK